MSKIALGYYFSVLDLQTRLNTAICIATTFCAVVYLTDGLASSF